MLPLYLSIEGLYSYQQKQEIDFTNLSEAGLFGIFGSVGSGKSSILEAIGYALYGETERLNSKEKRTYNMLNLKSNQVLIDFQFLNYDGRKFRFVAQWRRKKKFQDITDHERNAYEWKDNNWLPLESNDGAEITNLSYANFKRTIIIPQGQFKEFLELKGKDRSEMMKEIFFLNKYDLGPKVSNLLAENNKKLEHLKGALSGFEEINTEIIEEKNELFLSLEKGLIELKNSFEQLEIQHKALQITKQNRLDLVGKQNQLTDLEEKKSHIQKIESEVNEYELVSTYFREHILNLNHINTNKKLLLTKIENLKESKDSLKVGLDDVEKRLEITLPAYQNLDKSKAEVQDLLKVIQNLELKEVKKEKLANIDKGNSFYEKQKKEEQKFSNIIKQLEQEIDNIKNSKINTSELLAIDSWYTKRDQINNQIVDEKDLLNKASEQLFELKDIFIKYDLNESNWLYSLDSKYHSLASKEFDLKNDESDLRLKKELSQYIHNLHDGEPCPLCGSNEHPSPMQIENLDMDFENLSIQHKNLIDEKTFLDKLKSELSLAASKISEKKLELEKLNQSKLVLEKVYDDHLACFIWPDFDENNRDDFEIKKSDFFKIEALIIQKEKFLQENRTELQNTRELLHKSEQKLNNYQNEISVLEGSIKQNLQQIQSIDVKDYLSFDKFMLDNSIKERTSEINSIQRSYEDLTKKLLEFKTQYAQVKGTYIEAQEQYVQYSTKAQELQKLLTNLLIEFKYSDIASVQLILNKGLDTNALRGKVQSFQVAYQTLTNQIQELLEKTENDNYSDEKFDELSNLIVVRKNELMIKTESYGALKDDLMRLNIELERKKDLLVQYEQLEVRKKNLDILFNMFKGNGFVNYVSSIHLHRLCEIANHRFNRLTKNQLSLVINENNEFEVIDYLNDGYRRSAKTLSGGQSFQASLCLALALAENIQWLNKADKNFFFIDEGFGTQDSESINTVFDTLQYLHQENRIVGIISHVEELKERMPRSITVVKDMEKGSQIIVN
ncbi:AAA family ATPase [Sphingobacterium bovistauri]|uniref:Exonuclease SbcC n=1 Tax=Sphingobacterium bovistauri TaxID=2781959 RepID=A0ABS7Z014_9SPHI|nr:SbcC/MukB-like Walker B domain-containing protein [Sphingobacterium bovistauri]MCA5003529.1 hypothetical protein [Sphingobacterium bovistauri]